MPSKNKVLFLTLRVFSATGGIEKVCRVAGKALYELGLQYGGILDIFSMYGKTDNAAGNKYFPQLVFRGFNARKISFVFKSVMAGRRHDFVIMSHVNLLLVGFLVKLSRPSVKLVLLAHGIEVWKPFPRWKRYMLNKCDLILPVSHFTRDRMISLYGISEEKFSVMNNCLEPFMERPLEKGKPAFLLERYGVQKEQQVILTVSRMSDTEQYKGYDRVIESLPALIGQYPGIRYLLIGKYDAKEKQRLDEMICRLGLGDVVIFTGFIPDEEMPAHFTVADLFIMPSEKEGFGIVFIEAMYYGLPVIAGNKDGSVDALWRGEMGTLVDPNDLGAIATAIKHVLDDREQYLPDPEKLEEHFSYTWYKRKLHNCLGRLKASSHPSP